MLPADGSAVTAKSKPVPTEEALCITTAAPSAGIPAQELVVVFDADMCAKPNFFRHVSAVYSAQHSGCGGHELGCRVMGAVEESDCFKPARPLHTVAEALVQTRKAT